MGKHTLGYDLFIFDFDGTLADSRKNIANSLNFAFQEQGLKSVPAKKVFPLIGKVSIEQTFTFFYPGLRAEDIQKLTSVFRTYQRNHLRTELVLYPGVVDTLEQLKKHKKKLAILTTKHIDQIRFILHSCSLDGFFDVVYGDGLLSVHKPDKQCVEYIWAGIEPAVVPDRTVMVGDSSVDALTARNAGIGMIGVGYGIDGKKALLAQGVANVVDRFADIVRFSSDTI